MNQIIKNYKGFDITFESSDDIKVNATEMAKPFNKRPSKWLELTSTLDFLSVLCEVRNKDITSFVKTSRGNFADGSEQGTWMHEDVAIEFARWLSPMFSIWCNDMVKELVNGEISTSKAISRRDLALMIIDAENEIDSLKTEVNELKPKVEYLDKITNSDNTYTTTEIAKSLGMSAGSLNKLLHEYGIQYKQNNVWFLYSKYQGKNLTKLISWYNPKNGKSILRSVWTEKGREFIYNWENNRQS